MYASVWLGVRRFLSGDMAIKILLAVFESGMEPATMADNFQGGAGAWRCAFTAPLNGRSGPCCAFAENMRQINLSISLVTP